MVVGVGNKLLPTHTRSLPEGVICARWRSVEAFTGRQLAIPGRPLVSVDQILPHSPATCFL